MAFAQEVPSFDDLIQAGRDRKKAESLANEIFGKGRRTSSPLHASGRTKSGVVHNLASRISKPGQRAASSSSITRTKFQAVLNKDAELAVNGRGFRKKVSGGRNAPILTKDRNGNMGAPKEFSIRGAAGPYCVVGSNFAPGTTSADIQSAMEPITGEMLSCNILTSHPMVVAEMVFADKACAETVVATFNNQKADGRLLKVYHKDGPPTKQPEAEPASAPVPPPQVLTAAPESRESRELISEKPRSRSYISRSPDNRRAEPEYQDGRYGFDSKEDEMEVDADEQRAVQVEPSRSETSHEPHNEHVEEGNRYVDDHRERQRYGYRQGYSRDARPDRGDYGGRDNRYRSGPSRRPAEPNRLYSDQMYGYRSRGHGYR